MVPQLIISAIMMVISQMLQSAGMKKPVVKDPEPGKLDIPTAEQGKPIPVIFGTCIVKSSNVVWYGDARTEPIKSKSAAGGKK